MIGLHALRFLQFASERIPRFHLRHSHGGCGDSPLRSCEFNLAGLQFLLKNRFGSTRIRKCSGGSLRPYFHDIARRLGSFAEKQPIGESAASTGFGFFKRS